MRYSVFTVFILLIAVIGNTSPEKVEGKTAKQNKMSGLKRQQNHLVIELGLFCDMEFSRRFNFDRQSILQYWEVVLYDLHLRFKSLSSFNISFRVSALHIFEKTEEQPFLEFIHKQDTNHTVDQLWIDWHIWIDEKFETLPKFDIGILQLGGNLPGTTDHWYYSKTDSICQGGFYHGKRLPSLIIQPLVMHPSDVLPEEIALVMGIPDNRDMSHWHICNGWLNSAAHCCILRSERPHTWIYPRFFSHCSDVFLVEKMKERREQYPECLDGSLATKKALIDTAKLFQRPDKLKSYSMREQCQILTGADKVKIIYKLCNVTMCKGSGIQKKKPFVPLEMSQCGRNGEGRCIRGQCVKPQVQLLNVGTGKCLASQERQFSPLDQPVLRDCLRMPTDLLIGTKIEEDNKYLPTLLYASSDGPRPKFLKVGRNFKLRFEATEKTKSSEWEIIRLKERNYEEFLLQHSVTRMFAKGGNNGSSLEVDSSCISSEPGFRWKFVKLGGGFEPEYEWHNWGFTTGYFLGEEGEGDELMEISGRGQVLSYMSKTEL